ncbi:threonine synthase, partial [Candidatus Uhrbacteria bacterium]|nr:threonine synthase [Candidatus Uhrbacteria bacterium]
MQFLSTHNPNLRADLRAAVLNGLAPDGGLFLPVEMPCLSADSIARIPKLSFQELSLVLAKHFFTDSLDDTTLSSIVGQSLTFDAPLSALSNSPDTAILELFHGPTLSFKDFGARFMACLMSYFVRQTDEKITVLVATSGDTGSAVASGFFAVPGIRVCILYPSGKVSDIQEKQLTTYGENITALEVDGVFDDCQRLVKQAFQDKELRSRRSLGSANSINIARLIPQTFYYAWAYAHSTRMNEKKLPLVCCVPSGNFGNLTAGLLAKRIGIPIARFIAATNINDPVPEYLRTGIFRPRPSRHTISNAMDVGDPSNFARMLELYKNDAHAMRRDIWGSSFTDEQTYTMMKQTYDFSGYILDPHGAVALLGIEAYRSQHTDPVYSIALETAHPAKFSASVEHTIGIPPALPDRLAKTLMKQKKSIRISNRFEDLKEYLLK